MPPPVKGPITQGYGPTDEPLDSGYNGYAHFNKGFDYGVPEGTSVQPTVGGEVIWVGDHGDRWGYSVWIMDAEGNVHQYGHLKGATVAVGQEVRPGQQIALSGNTGASTGDHLSYDVRNADGQFIDPSPWASGVGTGEPSVEETQYWEKRSQLDALVKQYGLAYGSNGEVARDNYGQFVQQRGFPSLTPDIASILIGLDTEIGRYEEQSGMASPSDIKGYYDFRNSTDPRVTDAANAANRYGREYNARVQAATGAANAMQDQLSLVDAASKTRMGWAEDSQGRRQPGSPFGVAPPAKLKSGDELFQEALNRIKSGLPEVPDLPYPERPSRQEYFSGGMPQRPPARQVATASIGAGGPGAAMRMGGPSAYGNEGSGGISGSIMQPAGASATYGSPTTIEPPAARLSFMDRLRGKLPTIPSTSTSTNLGTAPWKRGRAGGGF